MSLDFSRRATDPESLDIGVPPAEALKNLADLRFVNRWLGRRSALRAAVQPYLLSSDRPRLLDVGCGSGDVSSFLARSMPRPVQAVGLDLKLTYLRPLSVKSGTISAEGKIIKLGRQTSYTEGFVRDGAGNLAVHATATFSMIGGGPKAK